LLQRASQRQCPEASSPAQRPVLQFGTKQWEEITMKIDFHHLLSVNPMSEKTAKAIIGQAKKATINGKPAKVEYHAQDSSIIVEVPSDLGNPPYYEVTLTNDRDEILALLEYDPKSKKFLAKKE
jgi:hypothetical protein